MKFEIELSVPVVKPALNGLAKAIGKSSLPALRCVRLERDDSGKVTLQTTDLDSSISFQVPGVHPGPATAFLVPWELFAKTIKSAKERVAFALEAEGKVIARSFLGSMAFEEAVEISPLSEWPVVPSVAGPSVSLDGRFKTAFSQALECASTDGSRTALSGVCLDVTQNGDYLVATDGRHLYSANSFRFGLPESITIPARKFLFWTPFYVDGDWALSLHKGKGQQKSTWARIDSAHWNFRTKLPEGSYPNWNQIIPRDEMDLSRIRLTPEASAFLLETLPRIPVLERDSYGVSLITRSNGLFISSQQSSAHPVQEIAVPTCVVQGTNRTIRLNRNYMVKALSMGLNEIEVRDPLTPVLFHSEGKRLVIAPLRGGEPGNPQNTPAPEPSQPVSPSPAGVSTPTEDETKTSMTTETTTSPQSTTKPAPQEQDETPLKSLVSHLEAIRTSLKEVLNQINQSLSVLKTAEREQKATEKEIQSVRSTLRSLQKVQI